VAGAGAFGEQPDWDGDLDSFRIVTDFDALGINAAEVEAAYAEFDTLLQEYFESYSFEPGARLVGTVLNVSKRGAQVDIGAKLPAFCPASEASLVPTTKIKSVLVPGMRRWFEIIPRGAHRVEPEKLIISASKVEAEVTWARLNQLKQEDVTLEATVEIISRGGLIVSGGGVRGFIPASHVRTTEAAGEEGVQVGTVLPVKFLELDQAQERCLFSHRRALSDSQLKSFKVGDVVMGTIISVKAYGAFVDIGGDLNGLLHVSQISHDRLSNVESVLSVSDKLKVMILSHDKERGRISLSTKKLEPTPGDMIRNPQLVFEKADEMAAQFRERVAAAEAAARLEEARMQQMRESAFKEEEGPGEADAAPSE
jgi:small subunit ribosomal protein S1